MKTILVLLMLFAFSQTQPEAHFFIEENRIGITDDAGLRYLFVFQEERGLVLWMWCTDDPNWREQESPHPMAADIETMDFAWLKTYLNHCWPYDM